MLNCVIDLIAIPILKPFQSYAKNKTASVHAGYLFDMDTFVVDHVTNVVVLSTYGIVTPPLALAGCFAIFTQTYFRQLLCGYLIRKAQKEGMPQYIEILNFQCKGLEHCIRRTLLAIPLLSSLIYSAFIFDLMGDKDGVVK